MRSILAGLRQLALPWGAPSTVPRIVIGPDIPPALAAATPDFTWTAAIIQWFNATDFAWQAIGYYNLPTPGSERIVGAGTYDAAHGMMLSLEEHNAAGSVAPPRIFYGSDVYNATKTEWYYQNGSVNFQATGDLRFDGFSSPRSCVGYASSVAASPAIGAVEQMVLTIPAVTIKAGRCYSVRWNMVIAPTVANQNFFRIYRGGSLMCELYKNLATTNFEHVIMESKIRNQTAGDITDVLNLGLRASAGTVQVLGNAQRVASLEVVDVGAAANFPNVIDF